MSKAFVNEDTLGPAEILPDREISPHANLVTAEGLAQIEATIARLQNEHNKRRLKHRRTVCRS